jgi:hypothetical protein
MLLDDVPESLENLPFGQGAMQLASSHVKTNEAPRSATIWGSAPHIAKKKSSKANVHDIHAEITDQASVEALLIEDTRLYLGTHGPGMAKLHSVLSKSITASF